LRQFGNELISRSRQNRINGFEQQMQLLVNSYTAILEADSKKIEMALLLQAREAEKCLAAIAKPPAKVYLAQDYNAGKNLPADITPSRFHFRLLPNETTEMLKVSYTHQVFKFPTIENEIDIERDIGRLSTMTPMYRGINERLQGLIFWQTTILSNGLMSAYPGHNGIPLPLDPREQPWYQNAIQSAEDAWSSPYIDPETRRVVIAAARPIKRPNGSIAGVTALIIPVSGIFDRRLLTENTPREALPFLIHLAKQDNTGKTGARILAHPDRTGVAHIERCKTDRGDA
jgi:hypothetical protein